MFPEGPGAAPRGRCRGPGGTGMTEAPELRVDAVQVAGIYAPLAYMSPSDPLQGGYQWLSPTDGGATRHPGADLNSTAPGQTPGGNADLGAPVVAAVDAVVTYVGRWDGWSTGYGDYVVLETTDERATPQVWLKHCHLDRILVNPGQLLRAGEQLGTCGHSGTTWAHLHWEVIHTAPPSWGTWPYGWSVEQVERYWMRPADWYFATVATAMAQQGGGDAVAILNGAQQAAIQAAVWGSYWNPDAADFAIPKSWREEWKAGRWRGAPTAAEQMIPASEDKPAGSFQLFTAGCACWLPGQDVSWEG